jgi:hypothetical protein
MKIHRSISKVTSVTLLVIKIISCANPVSPTGGIKDNNSPKIKSFKITEIENKKHLLIQFDENIVFQNNIELSPYKNKNKPEVKVYRNQIVILLDSNTNSINFNDAIKDLNEGNKAVLSNLIIGSDSSIKYYKIKSIPKNKDKILAYSQHKQYIYPYNTTVNGYAIGEGLPNTTNLKTTIFIDQNKNQKYDSTEWAFTDTLTTILKSFNRLEDTLSKEKTITQNDRINQNLNILTDTIEAILYPPIQNEIKYFDDSNQKKTLIIVSNSKIKHIIRNQFKSVEQHADTLVFAELLSLKEIQFPGIKYKKTRTTINESSKVIYYQYIYDKDTIYFQERNLSNFNIKKIKQDEDKSYDPNNKASTSTDSIPLLDMSNPFSNPHGSTYTDIPGIQNEIEQVQKNLGIQFTSFSQMQKQLRNELKTTKTNSDKLLKPKELKKLGRIIIENDSNFNCGLSIYKEGEEIITFNCEKGKKTIVLPVGNYQYFTWKDTNQDSYCSQPEEILEYFFEMEVLEKIENTIIVKKTKIQEKNVKIPAIIQSE